MKKRLLTAILLMAPLAMSAQWTTKTTESDELKGTSADVTYAYTDSITGHAFIYWASSNEQFAVMSGKKIFNYSSSNGYTGLSITAGLYTSSGDLKEKITMWLDVEPGRGVLARTRNSGKMSNPVGQAKKAKKIISHLTGSDGYVRIIANLYGGESFDLTIPHR